MVFIGGADVSDESVGLMLRHGEEVEEKLRQVGLKSNLEWSRYVLKASNHKLISSVLVHYCTFLKTESEPGYENLVLRVTHLLLYNMPHALDEITTHFME